MQTRIVLLLSAMALASGCGVSKTRIEYVPKEVVRRESVQVPQELLTRYCSDLVLRDLVTRADMEEALARAFTCVRDHNADKDKIENLK